MYVCHANSLCYCRYISHYGSGTASLNVTVAGSIVLHQFGIWAKYDERAREGEKYIVNHEELKPFNDKDGVVLTQHDTELRQQRAQKKAALAAAAESATISFSNAQDSSW